MQDNLIESWQDLLIRSCDKEQVPNDISLEPVELRNKTPSFASIANWDVDRSFTE